MSRRSAGPSGAADPASSGPVGSAYPGANLGLPRTGRGSVASWFARCTALVLDWALSMLVAVLVFGSGVLTAGGWRSFMILTVFFVQVTLVSTLAGGSVGQLICRIGVARLDGALLGFPRAVIRAAMVCLVIPALVIDENRRGLHDLLCGTVVASKR